MGVFRQPQNQQETPEVKITGGINIMLNMRSVMVVTIALFAGFITTPAIAGQGAKSAQSLVKGPRVLQLTQ
jgi:hypothetical protein